MKRLIIAAGFLMALAWPASVAAAPPAWNLTGVYTINFTCTAGCGETYIHSMTITTSNDITGFVAGTGSVQGYPGSYWTVIGTVSGSDVELDIEWVSPPIALSFNPLILMGTIDSSGGMSGTAIDGLQRTFTWATTDGAAATIAPTATPTTAPTATPTPSQAVEGETATPRGIVTLPPTSTGSGSSSDNSTPLFALLICLAFGGLGLAAAEAQRRSIRS